MTGYQQIVHDIEIIINLFSTFIEFWPPISKDGSFIQIQKYKKKTIMVRSLTELL